MEITAKHARRSPARRLGQFIVHFWKDILPKGKVWFFLSLLFLLALAPVLNWYIQYSIETASSTHALGFIGEHPTLFIFGAFLLFLVLCIYWALFSNAFLGAGIFSVMFSVVLFGDRTKFELRMEHVVPDDLLVALFNGSDFSSFYSIWDMILSCWPGLLLLAAAVVTTLLRRRYKKKYYVPDPGRKDYSPAAFNAGSEAYARFMGTIQEAGHSAEAVRRMPARRSRFFRICIRVCVIAYLFTLLLGLTIPMRNITPQIVPMIDYEEIAWNQLRNYDRNGFVMAFTNNIKHYVMPEPDGYSEEEVFRIVDQYTELAASRNNARIDPADENIDIVFVMNESFCDPTLFTDLYPYSVAEEFSAENPAIELVPNLHRIEQETASGYILSPRYGGGTSHVEFEALTGFSLYFLGSLVPFQSIVAKHDDFPSFARFLSGKTGADDTEADGAEAGSDDADSNGGGAGGADYQTIGLHSYNPTMYRRHAAYPSMGFDEFYGSINYRNKAHDQTTWYISDKSSYTELNDYLDRDRNNKFVMLVTMQNHTQYGNQYSTHHFRTTASVSASDKLKIDDYMELLHSSDAALGELIAAVDARGKKTVLVFWGDHLPSVYNRLLEEESNRAYETPFFIYSNFETGYTKELDIVSPNFIRTKTLDYLNAEKAPFDYLLDEVMKKSAGLTLDSYHGEMTEAMEDYRMIEYDVISGEGYAMERGFFNVP